MSDQTRQILKSARVPLALCGVLAAVNIYLFSSGAYVDIQALLEAICFPSMETLQLRGALGFSGEVMTASPHPEPGSSNHLQDIVAMWTPDLSWASAYVDLIRLAHLAGVAIGLGTVVSAALSVRQMITKGMTRQLLDFVDKSHRQIACAIAILWISGLALIGVRTNFDPSAFSPKLVTKLAVVTILTIDAVLMRQLVAPLLKEYAGRPLAALALPQKLLIANCAALSGASWLYALMLGASSILKTAQAPLLATIGLAVYGGAYLIAIGFSMALHRSKPVTLFGYSMPLRYHSIYQR
ncbi:hypothetical protein [Roseibium sp.]|uniref:hypothetical protein n=1 Tax=Roseibium sp. TaxID=1936156 RepID=UPI003B515EC5